MTSTLPDALTPMTKTDWADLTLKQQWDVKVALRGPDLHNNNLKLYTTAIIRWACSNVMRVGGTVNHACPVIVLPLNLGSLSRGEQSAWGFDTYHFITHIQEAAEILNIPTVSIPRNLWEDAFANNVQPLTFYNLLIDGLHCAYDPIKPPAVEKALQLFTTRKAHLEGEIKNVKRYFDALTQEDDDDDNDE